MGQVRFDVRPIRTLEELIHAVMNSLSLISSHSQYLLGKRPPDAKSAEELQVIYEEAERAASLLSMVPRGAAKVPVQDAQGRDPLMGGRPQDADGVDHGKRRR
jgi:hypothetical protein